MHLDPLAFGRRTLVAGLVAGALALGLPLPAQADVGDTLSLQGRLLGKTGFPVPDGDYGLTIAFYKGKDDAQPLAVYVDPGVKLAKGVFTVAIGAKVGFDLKPFTSGEAGWAGIQVGSDPELPRLPLHQVPYAVRAKVALAVQCTGCIGVDHLDPQVLAPYAKAAELAPVAKSGQYGDLQGVPTLVALDQACGAGKVVAGVDAAGKIVCLADQDTTYGGKDFALSAQACATGSVVVAIDGSGKAVCAPDQDTQYGGKDFALAGQACSPGQVVTGIDANGKPLCAGDKDTTYTGADFALSNKKCTAGQVVTGIDASGNPTCAADKDTTYTGANFALSNKACTAGQVVRGIDANGNPVCIADANTTYTGANFALSNKACTTGQVVRGIDANGNPLCIADANTTYTAGTGLSLVSNQFAIAANAIASGQIADAYKLLSVRNGSNVEQIAVTDGNSALQIVGAGATSVTFDANNHRVTITSTDDDSGGTVKSVTASAPLASSGGVNPNLSLGTVGVGNGGTGLTSAGTAGHYLRSNGSAWTSSVLAAGDLPAGSAHYVQNQTAVGQSASFRITGGATAGTFTVANSGTTLGNDQGGALELGHAVASGSKPYVDFHYGVGSSQDYNVRVQNSANGTLQIAAASGSATVDVVGELQSRSIKQVDDQPATTYSTTLERYHLKIGYSKYYRRTKQVPQPILEGLCGDEDGCEVIIGMRNWESGGVRPEVAHYSFRFFYDPPTGWWRRDNTLGSTDGRDGASGTQHVINAFDSCFFTDGVYNVNDQGDPGKGMSLLYWTSYAGSNSPKTCELTLID